MAAPIHRDYASRDIILSFTVAKDAVRNELARSLLVYHDRKSVPGNDISWMRKLIRMQIRTIHILDKMDDYMFRKEYCIK